MKSWRPEIHPGIRPFLTRSRVRLSQSEDVMAVIGELSAVEQLLGRCANRFLGLAKKSQDEANAARKEIGGSRIVAQALIKKLRRAICQLLAALVVSGLLEIVRSWATRKETGAAQVVRELLRAERGNRLQNPIVRPAVVFEE